MKKPGLKAPFPWFGGKSLAAPIIWERIGDVPNYVEPFAGSLAVLLARPHAARIETVNDKDGYVCNFWRSLRADPAAVAHHADWPVNELDLHARHLWLVNEGRDRVARLLRDPDFYDAQVAGWWVWGQSCWIGGGWCSGKGPLKQLGDLGSAGVEQKWPHLADAGRGITVRLPHLGDAGKGVTLKHPHLASAGRGVQARSPHLASAGRGVVMQRPHLSSMGQGVVQQIPRLGAVANGVLTARAKDLQGYMQRLSDRLRDVRVCCGDWQRVVSAGPTVCNGLTAVLLDPPYAQGERDTGLYLEDDPGLSDRVREWALLNGDNPLMRIALCGYEGEHQMPLTWDCVAWKGHGGYSNRGNGKRNSKRRPRPEGTGTQANQNRTRERIWFSPHCLAPFDLFGVSGDGDPCGSVGEYS